MKQNKIEKVKDLIEQEGNPTEDESPKQFCNRILQNNEDITREDITREDIIICLYYYDLVLQKYEGETGEGETRWTDTADKMFVGKSEGIRDIKQRI